MRFCLLTTFYPPYNFGGDGIDVQRTARALAARGHEVTVVHDIDSFEWLSGRYGLPPADEPHGVEVIGLRSAIGVFSSLLTHQFGTPVVHRAKITSILKRGFDVVIFNNVSLVGGPGLLSFGADAFKVYMAHEHWLVCPTHVLWRFNREKCDQRSCTRCVISHRRVPQQWRYTGALARHLDQVDLYIARSEFSRMKHKEFGFARPMEVLPYFLPGRETPPDSRPSLRPHERPYFLFVGRLTKIKGVDTIIPAFARYPDADLLIIGDGDERPHLMAMAEGLANVHFLGWVPNEQLGPYYDHAIASVVPSVGYETFGIVLIESLERRTPVLARRLGPFTENIEESNGGMLFSTADELLAAAASLQRDAALRESLARSGFEACRERWSEKVVIGRLLEMIETGRRAKTARR
jgi:glycosyltransferase involved in cell wall biosynthesis